MNLYPSLINERLGSSRKNVECQFINGGIMLELENYHFVPIIIKTGTGRNQC